MTLELRSRGAPRCKEEEHSGDEERGKAELPFFWRQGARATPYTPNQHDTHGMNTNTQQPKNATPATARRMRKVTRMCKKKCIVCESTNVSTGGGCFCDRKRMDRSRLPRSRADLGAAGSRACRVIACTTQKPVCKKLFPVRRNRCIRFPAPAGAGRRRRRAKEDQAVHVV